MVARIGKDGVINSMVKSGEKKKKKKLKDMADYIFNKTLILLRVLT